MTAMRNDFFDYDSAIQVCLKNRTSVDDLIQLNEMKNRKIYLNEDIDDMSAETTCKLILQYNSEDKSINPEDRVPILLYVDTAGGELTAGFRIIDTILMSKTPVKVICTECCYSMGFLIFIAGHKRYASKNARFLLHDGSLAMAGTTGKAKDQFEFNNKSEERIKKFVCEHTKIFPKTYDKNVTREWYMFADYAKNMGVVDYIIGEDCDIDDII